MGFSGFTQSETKDTASSKKTKIIVLPVVYSTPETSLALGAGTSISFPLGDSESISSVQFGGVYTLRKQLLIYLPFNLFWKNDLYRSKGEVGFYDYVFEYYGIGDQPEAQSFYDAQYPLIKGNVLRRLKENLYGGLSVQYDNFRLSNFQGETITENEIFGTSGGAVSLLGPEFQYDTRDNVYYSTKGWYLQSSLLMGGKLTGSKYNMQRFVIDARYFEKVGKSNVLGFNLNQIATFGKAPFYQLAALGGNRLFRGYYQGYLRDKVFVGLQSEWRGPLFWRLGYAVFAGIGTVSPSYSKFFTQSFWPSYGAGIRFLLDKDAKINLRVDYAFGRDNSAFYLSFGEAF